MQLRRLKSQIAPVDAEVQEVLTKPELEKLLKSAESKIKKAKAKLAAGGNSVSLYAFNAEEATKDYNKKAKIYNDAHLQDPVRYLQDPGTSKSQWEGDAGTSEIDFSSNNKEYEPMLVDEINMQNMHLRSQWRWR